MDKSKPKGGPLVMEAIPDAEIAKGLTMIEQVEKALQGYILTLSTRQRRATLKMKPSGDKVVGLVGRISREQGISVASAPLPEMEAAMVTAQRLQPLAEAVQAFAQGLNDTILAAESQAWSGATLYYSVLARIARGNPRLAAALAPARKVFARRSPGVKKVRAAAKAERQAKQAEAKIAVERAKKGSAVNGAAAQVNGNGAGWVAKEPAAANGVAKAASNGVS